MANHNNVLLGIKLLMGTCRHFAHGYMLAAFDMRGGVFPWLSDIEQRKRLLDIEPALKFMHRNFVVHLLGFLHFIFSR